MIYSRNHVKKNARYDAMPEEDKSGLILGLHPANERRRYNITHSLVGWAET